MKLEHLLQLYWTKGYLFGGKLYSFNQPNKYFIKKLNGVSNYSYIFLLKRFELNALLTDEKFTFNNLSVNEFKIINIFFARLININNNIFGYFKLNLIRLYLTKTYRGRCQAIGKPAHGQRTWSNAWTAYKYNKVIRLFIANTLKKKDDSEQIFTYKIVQKKKKKKKKKTNKYTNSRKK